MTFKTTGTGRRAFLLVLTLLAAVGVAWLSPADAVLGERVRLVYFHGAWVWTGKVAFALAGLAGLLSLLGGVLRRIRAAGWTIWSKAFAWTGMLFWLTYLPMSLVVQWSSWGGIAWDEPRWRIPLAFGIAGLLLQAALWLFNHATLTGLGNLGFAIALWLMLNQTQNAIHPDSPIFSSGSVRIIGFFLALGALCLLLMLQIAFWIRAGLIKKSEPQLAARS